MLDSCHGLLARAARFAAINGPSLTAAAGLDLVKKTKPGLNKPPYYLGSPETRYNALKNPEWKGIRTKLAKTFPECGDVTRDPKYDSFAKAAASVLVELKSAHEFLKELILHTHVHLTTLKTMLAGLPELDLGPMRSTTRDVVALFNGYVRLVYFIGTFLEDRKAIASLYAAASAAKTGQPDAGFPPMARPLRYFDDPSRTLNDQFREFSGKLTALVVNCQPTLVLMTGGAAELVRRLAFTMTNSSADLANPSRAPLDQREPKAGRLLHVDLLENGRLLCDFCVLATMACPAVLAGGGGAMLCAQLAVNDGLVVPLHGAYCLNVQTELEALAKWWSPAKHGPATTAWPRDLKLPKLFKDWAKEAVQQCGLYHRERRAYLTGELEVVTGLLSACPGLAAPKAPLALAALHLGLDEALWHLRHLDAAPRKDRLKNYVPSDFAEPHLAAFLGHLAKLELLLRRQRGDVARYYVEFLAGADATNAGKLAPEAAAAANSVLATMKKTTTSVLLGTFATRCRDLASQTPAVEAAAKQLAIDGRFVAGRFSAAAIRSNPVAVLALDWRRVAAVLAADPNAASAAPVRAFMAAMGLAMDHCALADGTYLEELGSLGVLWPYRARLLELTTAATEGNAATVDSGAAAGMMRALLSMARDAMSRTWHPACFEDLRDIEAGGKFLATAACEICLAGAMKTALARLTTNAENLAEQVVPVQAAYRAERREAALEEQRSSSSSVRGRRQAKPPEDHAAGYESFASNSKLVEPIMHAEARLSALIRAAGDYDGATADGPIVVGDVCYRPLEYARDAVLAFVEDQVRGCFFDDQGRLRRPTTIDRSMEAVLAAAQRAASYLDLDYGPALRRQLTGRRSDDGLVAAVVSAEEARTSIATEVASKYVIVARAQFAKEALYIPNREAWVVAASPEALIMDKSGVSNIWAQLYNNGNSSVAERYLSRAEVGALIRLLGHDGAIALDRACVRAAVDEMAKLRPLVTQPKLAALYAKIKEGFLKGAWVEAAKTLKDAGVLDRVAESATKLGNLLILRQLVREGAQRNLARAAPHLAASAKLSFESLDAAKRCEVSPPWLLMPAQRLVQDPRSFHEKTSATAEGTTTTTTPLRQKAPAGFETDATLFNEARALMDSPNEWVMWPYALAASLWSDATWKPARWVPDLNACSNGAHASVQTLKALAHCFNGVPATDPRSSTRSTAMVAQYVETAAALVTHMRIHEKQADFDQFPLRAMCLYLELAVTEAAIPRSFLEGHLPFAVIHHALMDISMGRQTSADDKHAGPQTTAVFDVEEQVISANADANVVATPK